LNFSGRFKGNDEDEKYFQLKEKLKRWEEAVESTVGKESNLSA